MPKYKDALKFSELRDYNGNLHGGSIGSIFITGAGFIRREFKGISPDSQFGWEELVWKKSPTRSNVNFAMKNIDNIQIGKIPRLEINYKTLDINDFIDLRKIINNERHFTVEYFNMDIGRWVTRDMYCTESSKSKFFMLNKSIISSLDCSLKLVGTNNDLKVTIGTDDNGSEVENYELIKYKIEYTMGDYSSNGNAPNDEYYTYASGVTLKAPTNIINPPVGQFYWVSRDSYGNINGKYLPNQKIVIWDNLNLEANWE